jgi:hypothetical protein
MNWKSFRKKVERSLLQHLRYLLIVSVGRPAPAHPLSANPEWKRALPKEGPSPIIVTACDQAYFEKHAPAFVASVSEKSSAAHIHFHLYNFGRAEDIVRRFDAHRNVTITITHEEIDFDALERRSPSSAKQSWRSLYICCSRFLAAREVMRASNKAVVLFDVDILFNKPIDPFFASLADYDAALLLRPSERFMNKRTLGGFVYFATSTLGTLFMDTVCGIIGKFLAQGRYWWAFDQLALHKAVARMQARPAFRSLELDEGDISFEMSPDSLIWYPKGQRKQSPRFAQAQQVLLDKFGN